MHSLPVQMPRVAGRSQSGLRRSADMELSITDQSKRAARSRVRFRFKPDCARSRAGLKRASASDSSAMPSRQPPRRARKPVPARQVSAMSRARAIKGTQGLSISGFPAGGLGLGPDFGLGYGRGFGKRRGFRHGRAKGWDFGFGLGFGFGFGSARALRAGGLA